MIKNKNNKIIIASIMSVVGTFFVTGSLNPTSIMFSLPPQYSIMPLIVTGLIFVGLFSIIIYKFKSQKARFIFNYIPICALPFVVYLGSFVFVLLNNSDIILRIF